MRVLHVTDSYAPTLGGIELHVRDLARRQRAGGDETSVATITPDPDGTEPDVVRLPRLGRFPHPAGLRELAALVGAGGHDLVHAHVSVVSPLGWAGAAAAARAGLPTVVTLHSMLPGGLLAAPLRRLLPDAPDGVVYTAVSTVAAASLRRYVPGRRVGVLPNGIDPGDWRPAPDADEPARGGFTLVSTMRIAARKRPLPLLAVLARIRRTVPADVPLHAVIAGEGPLDGRLHRVLQGSDLGGWVTHAGRLDRVEIRALLARADLYLAPARLESFGIAALEARSAGVPVIGMARSGLRDFVRDGVEGFLVGSDAEMAARAAALLSHPGELRAVQRHNREHPPATSWASVLRLHRQAYAAAGALDARPLRAAGPVTTARR